MIETVATPAALVMRYAAFAVVVTMTVSSDSGIASSIGATFTAAELAPMGIVTLPVSAV